MTSLARISTPHYLDPALGKTCGSCAHCDMENPYTPSRMALCQPHDCAVKINRPTKCSDYAPARLVIIKE